MKKPILLLLLLCLAGSVSAQQIVNISYLDLSAPPQWLYGRRYYTDKARLATDADELKEERRERYHKGVLIETIRVPVVLQIIDN